MATRRIERFGMGVEVGASLGLDRQGEHLAGSPCGKTRRDRAVPTTPVSKVTESDVPLAFLDKSPNTVSRADQRSSRRSRWPACESE
jgi:hypothetical protein